MTIPVKEFHSGLPGAPVLADSTNSLIDLLHACLVTGYNVLPCAITVVGGVATVDVGPSQHALDEHMVSLIEGASPSALNGEKRVLAKIDATRYTYAAPGVPDGAAAGTISQRVAPAGWERPYHDSGAGLAVFRSLDVEASGLLFQVQDVNSVQSGWRLHRVRIYEDMTDASTGVMAAEALQLSRPVGTVGVKWVALASARTVYLLTTDNSGTYQHTLFPYLAFGDAVTYKPGDAHHGFVMRTSDGQAGLIDPASGGLSYIARNHLGTTQGVQISVSQVPLNVTGAGGANPVDGAVPYLFPRLLAEGNPINALRGEVPGVGHCLTSRGTEIAASAPKHSGRWERVTGVQVKGTARTLLHFGYPGTLYQRGWVFDVTGPWH